MQPIQEKIGKNLKMIRTNKGLSLDKTAELTGVSKAMLGQIERGESNPTVATLWKIASGLKVAFTSFIEEELPDVSVVSLEDIDPFIEVDGKYRAYPLFPFESAKRFEIFQMELEPGCVREAEGHQTGVEEYLIVFQGSMELVLREKSYALPTGHAIRFPADQPHTYRNANEVTVRSLLFMYYPL